jgi:hypothetical protein
LDLSNYNQSDKLREHRKTAVNMYRLFFNLYENTPGNEGLIHQIAQQDPELSVLTEGFDAIFNNRDNIKIIEDLRNAKNIIEGGVTPTHMQ